MHGREEEEEEWGVMTVIKKGRTDFLCNMEPNKLVSEH